ncbi:hypothetical protein [Roseateles oligotrophus]|uniref:Uncharacterized protein n=1 Tax=Roseateles oligotrophus TaxID=1769250 RepID=A0ABT2Y8Z1_9BURK|nr:hypothetical protein [Roseateles oligotrophus]MCV2366764.1 hypothetical protein [Roseateles oligotrophus]
MSQLALALEAPSKALVALSQDDRAELQRLNAERSAIETQFKAESDVCARRFFVNACLDEAKAKRSAGLKSLQEREAAIEANERRARADAQRERVAEREREFAEAEGRRRTAQLLAPAAPVASAPAKAKPMPASKHHPSSPQEAQQAKSVMALEDAQRRQQQKANFQSEQAARQKEAERRQAIAEAKLKGKKAPMALPIPSAAEIEAAGSAASAIKR